jgi:hypothetical protein
MKATGITSASQSNQKNQSTQINLDNRRSPFSLSNMEILVAVLAGLAT